MKKLQFLMAIICLIGAFICFLDSFFLSYEKNSMILGLVSILLGIIFFLFYLLEIKKEEVEKLRNNIRRINNLQWLLIIPILFLLQSCAPRTEGEMLVDIYKTIDKYNKSCAKGECDKRKEQDLSRKIERLCLYYPNNEHFHCDGN
jgi:hypothetical protein